MSRTKLPEIPQKTIDLFCDLILLLAPPPQLTVSEWADQYRRLSPEASAEPGQWRTSRTPFLKEIMDALSDPDTEKVVFMKSAQVGGTEFLLNALGYFISQDPSPILFVRPSVDEAKDFSKDRIAPMIRDTPVLRGKVQDAKSRDSNNTLLHKRFPGGQMTLVGANAASGLSSRPVRVVIGDEIDRFPASAGSEGDPISLAEKRTTTFWNKKILYVSTPGTKGESRIEEEHDKGTMEQWHLPCPSCESLQPLTWGQIRFEDVTHECKYCKERYDEFAWKAGEGIWIPRATSAKVRSFHINELASPWKRWETIIEEFKDAKAGGTETLKVWVNTALGESWEEQGDVLDYDILEKRREYYNCDLPEGVLVLTAGVDVQDDRLEVEVVGWGVGEESWGIHYRSFVGDPAITKTVDQRDPCVWDQLDTFLLQTWYYDGGRGLQLSAVCVDSGGHFTTEVYDYCARREHRRIFAIKGQGGEGVPIIGRPSRNNRRKVALFPVGVNSAKETLYSRLKMEYEGPGYCHFPREADKGYDEGYFKGLTSEKRVVRFYKGRPKVEWVKPSGARNEALDLRNYATAALKILNPNFEVLAAQEYQKEVHKPATRPRRRGTVSKGITI